MIVYDRLWTTMKRQGVSQYRLLRKYQFSAGQLDRLRKNENVSTYTLNPPTQTRRGILHSSAGFGVSAGSQASPLNALAILMHKEGK